MSSRYQKAFTIPEGFPSILKSFTREILRSQPVNIYEFGARYFAELVEANNAALQQAEFEEGGLVAEERTIFDMDDAELQDFILDIFLQFDADASGYLDRKEFKKCLQSAELGNLGKKEIRRIMSEADENDDGVLEYREFVPVMVEIVHGLKAKAEAAAAKEEAEEEAREAVEMHLLHGMPREELEALMSGIFMAADADGSGVLDRKEFSKCLKSAELGLSRKEINLLLSECDVDGDGKISYAEFMPLCFNILVERFKDEVLTEAALQSPDGLTQMIMEEFERSDPEGTGKLHLKVLKAALTDISNDMLGLSRLQITTIMSEAAEDNDKLVDYFKFAPTAAQMIYTMVDLSSQALRVDAVAKLSEAEGAQLLHSLNGDTIKSVLMAAFQEADKDGNGTLDRDEVYDVLMALGTGELALKQAEINAMVAAVDADEDGKVTYGELVDFLFDVLTHLERENYIQEVAFSAQLDKLEAEMAEGEPVEV